MRVQLQLDPSEHNRMLLNRLPKLNWAYALGEIMLIFIGVTAAFVFDSWKEERKSLREELIILSEIAEDLEATERDLAADTQTTTAAWQVQLKLLRLMTAEGFEVNESFARKLRGVFYAPVLVPKISGYKTLENIGLDTIRDPKLRSALTDFYELRLNRIQIYEGFLAEVFRDFSNALRPAMRVARSTAMQTETQGPSQPALPYEIEIDAEKLREIQSLARWLASMHSNTADVLEQYYEASREIRAIREELRARGAATDS
jgi:hypothetical protein